MANPLPNEAQMYQKFKDEKVTIPAFLWDAIYNFLGDYVSEINFLATYYVEQSKPIPVAEGKRILELTRKIMEVVHKVIYPQKITDEDGYFVRIKEESVQLPKQIRECFTHYIGNDTNIMNMCVCYNIDSQDEHPIPIEHARKILESSLCIRRFLDRLHEVTSSSEGRGPLNVADQNTVS